eukprot:CAMPEP_0170473940 /NCGR_PEP_ID=MMETSP0123-20130129/15771_1 /TAXON_ID=182087 /ORGANISM="Favella ehrenbergii, Strain Fehren 1" /LENGTH=50 /DNA_ID=CAMNT_0010743313 /DNA_START=278 /DNA_END=430 /DNA_ORIENTATION=-
MGDMFRSGLQKSAQALETAVVGKKHKKAGCARGKDAIEMEEIKSNGGLYS